MTAEEPFRALMPLGLLAAVLGALVWPLSMWGVWWAPVAPVEVHWRLMLEGFVGLFMMGFLGTSAPRLLGVSALSSIEALGIKGLALSLLLCAALGWIAIADLMFVLFVGALTIMLLLRWPLREDWPPPGFVLVGMGIAGTLIAASCLLFGHWAPLPAALLLFCRAWMAELWPLLPVMGVGAFFFPRFAKMPARHDLPEGRTRPLEWRALAIESSALGVLAVCGLLIEHFAQSPRIGIGLRLLAFSLFLTREFPPSRWLRVRGGSAFSTVGGLIGIWSGLALRVIWPASGTSGIHLLFIVGFALVIFGVATRVLLGHSGQSPQMHRLQPASCLLMIGVLCAAGLRLLVLWRPDLVMMAYHGGGFAFVLAVLIWAIRFLPAVLRPDDE